MYRSSALLFTHAFRGSVYRLSQSGFAGARDLIKISVACQKIHTSNCLHAIRTVNSPGFPESVAEGNITWCKKINDFVSEDDVVAEIETDKISIPVPALISGVIKEFLLNESDTVVSGQALFTIDDSEIAPNMTRDSVIENSVPPAAKVPLLTEQNPMPSPSPAPPEVSLSRPPLKSVFESTPLISALPAGVRTEQHVKMTRIRARTAERLKEAQNTCAMLTTFNEIDMSNLIDLRNQYKEAFFKKHGVKLGIMSSFSKASAFALQDQPIVNACIQGNEIVHRNYVDLSIAVASPKGLVVPVLRNVESMDFAAIERGIFELGEKAKAGNIAVEDMDGGTFTISNGGIFGSLFSTPIVNPPQSAILGLHGTFERPVVRNSQVVIRPMMYVALSYDHRLIDGREAVLFLRKIKSFIEDPRVFFLGL